MDRIIMVSADDRRGLPGPEVFQDQPLYSQPEFLSVVAPGAGFYARVEDKNGRVAWFPFCGKKYLGFWRIFQVAFCQRFEPFSTEGGVSESHWDFWFSFLGRTVFSSFWPFSIGEEGLKFPHLVQPKTNQILNLRPAFDTIWKSWKPGRKSALRKSEDCLVRLLKAKEFESILSKLCQTPGKGWKPDSKQQKTLNRISESESFRENLYRFSVEKEGENLCLILILEWKSRYHYLFSMSTDNGFEVDAVTRFFYSFFQQHAGEECWFDFEGSSLPGVLSFFKSLGSEGEPYFLFSKPLLGL